MGNDTGVTFERNTERLAINVEEEIKSDYPVCLKIVID
jgi:hypothetical protein